MQEQRSSLNLKLFWSTKGQKRGKIEFVLHHRQKKPNRSNFYPSLTCLEYESFKKSTTKLHFLLGFSSLTPFPTEMQTLLQLLTSWKCHIKLDLFFLDSACNCPIFSPFPSVPLLQQMSQLCAGVWSYWGKKKKKSHRELVRAAQQDHNNVLIRLPVIFLLPESKH